ncbi:MAG: hypothetical protein JRN35_04750 [Nitrososphaerota archaeon]|nr:hypothetical protein [Nitrososphaerota archaeon]
MGWGWGWRPYVPVARRRAEAARTMEKLRRKGLNIQPVRIEGREIAHTFWGQAWCEHLEKFSDFANRLPRGRTYVRNGSVCHLDIQEGRISAKVSGSELYDVDISIDTLPKSRWERLLSLCTGQVGSALELLQGRLSDRVMSTVTNREKGLFPGPREIGMKCSCPDWASMCKHVAAVLYGTGARLDEHPELLFRLRGVDYQDLLTGASVKAVVSRASQKRGRVLAEEEVGNVFGIDLARKAPSKSQAQRGKPSRTAMPRHQGKSAKSSRSRRRSVRTSPSQGARS